jgi:WD40 repeat protein
LDVLSWKDSKREFEARIILGVRSGDIIELRVVPNYIKDNTILKGEYPEPNQDTYFETIHFTEVALLKNHSSQSKPKAGDPSPTREGRALQIAVHPVSEILVSMGNDRILCLWNYRTGNIMDRYFIGQHSMATCLRYNADGTLLFVGFDDGSTKLFQSRAVNTEYRKAENCTAVVTAAFENPVLSLYLLLKQPNSANPVRALELSSTGHYLAISYDLIKVGLA